MTGLFALSMAAARNGSGLSSTPPLQDLCIMALCFCGLGLLALAAYHLQKAPPEIKDRRI